MAEHTPGPWQVRVDPQDGRAGLVTDGEAGIAAPFYAGRSTEEINANARLIAAAPDLLDALRGLVGIIDKAGLMNLSNGVQLGQTSWYVKASDRVDMAREAIAKAERQEVAHE